MFKTPRHPNSHSVIFIRLGAIMAAKKPTSKTCVAFLLLANEPESPFPSKLSNESHFPHFWEEFVPLKMKSFPPISACLPT